MTRIAVIGGTGYTGGHIIDEAARRGHQVTSLSRNAPAEPVAGVTYLTGSVLDDAQLAPAVAGADVVISALAPRGELAGTPLETVDVKLARLAAAQGARYAVVGGFSALRPAEGAPRMIEGDSIPAEFFAEARTMTNVLEELISSAPAGLDWLYISPAGGYGSHVPGEATGKYRVGGDVALFDENGNTAVSGADFALAIVDEIENPSVRSAHISIAY